MAHPPACDRIDPSETHPSALGGRARATVYAVAEALLSDESERGETLLPNSGLLQQVVDGVDLWIGATSVEFNKGFLAMLLGLDAMPLALLRKPCRFAALSIADRIHCLERLENSFASPVLMALKLPIVALAYEHPALLQETGFDRPTLSSRRSERSRP